MAKENKQQTATSLNSQLTYDQAMARVETIVQQLEQSEAISLSEYKQLAEEARQLLQVILLTLNGQLLAFCRNEVEKISKEFTNTN